MLLLSRDGTDGYLNKFLAVEITSTVRHIAVEVPLGRAEGMPRPCVANCDNIWIVSRSALAQRIGQIGPRRQVDVKRALGHAPARLE